MNVHFILDEVAAFGQAPQALKDAVSMGRGYKISTGWIIQSLGQLKGLFQEDGGQTLLSNTTQIFFGPNDLETAKYLNERLGSFTQVVQSGGTSSGYSRQDSAGKESTSYSRNRNSSWQQATRALRTVDEVLALDPREAITLVAGMRPIRTRLLRYYEERFSPGWFGEIRAAVGMLFKALIVLVGAGFLAFLTMKAINEKGQSNVIRTGGTPVWWNQGKH